MPAASLEDQNREIKKRVDQEFLKLLGLHIGWNRNLSAKPTARNYAPTVFMRYEQRFKPMPQQVYKQYMKQAMQRLLEKGVIIEVDQGPPSRPAPRLEIEIWLNIEMSRKKVG